MFDLLTIFWLIAIGFFNACMDARQWASRWRMRELFPFFDDSFLFEKGKRYLFFILWDFWHVSKNLMLISIGFAIACAQLSTFSTWELLLSPIIIGLSFIIFYHGWFRA